jgi:hypothetical protein
MAIIIRLPWSISTLLRDPLLLSWLEISLVLAVVLANDSFSWVVEAISDVVSTSRDLLFSVDVVTHQGLAVWSESLKLFSVEASILYGAVVPFFVFKQQFIIEEVLSLDQFASVPLGNISSL